MKRFLLLAPLWLALAGLARADTAPAEDLSRWAYYQDVAPPAKAPGLHAFRVPPRVFDRARDDLADLRLVDASGNFVPYALRVRESRNEQQEVPAKAFNRAGNTDGSVQLSLDLGEGTPEHNQVVVGMTGSNYRRMAKLEGSNDGKSWNTVRDGVELLDVRAAGQEVVVRTITYPPSRFRYLRVQVFPDRGRVEDQPELAQVSVLRTVRVPGETVTQPASVGGREAVPAGGAPGSSWIVTLPEGAFPVHRLEFDVGDEHFARTWTIAVERGPRLWQPVASGSWQRLPGEKQAPLVADFPEVRGWRFKLTVADHRNAPLTVREVRARGTVRQVVFAASKDIGPLKLYLGNPDAAAPNYDIAASLPPILDPPPAPVELIGDVVRNPGYVPPPVPWTERRPWLVYVVLGLASAVLLGVLGLLAREAVRRHDARAGERPTEGEHPAGQE